jgi:hypothetical protein
MRVVSFQFVGQISPLRPAPIAQHQNGGAEALLVLDAPNWCGTSVEMTTNWIRCFRRNDRGQVLKDAKLQPKHPKKIYLQS